MIIPIRLFDKQTHLLPKQIGFNKPGEGVNLKNKLKMIDDTNHPGGR